MSKTSFLGELLKRRVPQIAGLYIAATWMMIEIGDWMIERFHLSEHITSYIFVGMVVFIPSVFYLAYQYGKPGHDPWKKPTFLVVPMNLAVAIGAMFYFITPVEATVTKTVVDEQGVKQSYEVAKKEYQKSIINFFWKNKSNDTGLDWLQYGFSWLLYKDLNRSLFISSRTLFGESSILSKVKDSGFTKAISVPRTLKNQLAKRRFYQYAIDGSFEKVNDEFLLNVEVIDVFSGQKVAEHSVQGKDYFVLIDELSDAIKDSLNIPNDLNEQALDLPVSEHVSNSKKAIQLLIEAQKKRYFENDYPGAKALLTQAVEEDFSFAAAYGVLASVEQLSGNSQAAGEAIEKALKHEYKFTTQEKFDYKADVYAVKGDYESQSKVYDMWVELYPDSILAHRNRATLLRVTGLNHDKALESLKKIRELNPYDDSVLRDLAKLYILKDELDKAVLSLETFIKDNPQNTAAMIEVADVYDRQTEFDKARSILDKVLLLEQDNIGAALKVVRIDMKLNKFDLAIDRLNQLYSNAQNAEQKFTILAGFLGYYSQKGEINKAIEIAIEMEQNSQHLPPLLQIFMVKFQRCLLMASIGQITESLALLKEIQQQLQQPYSGMIDLAIVSVHTFDKNTVEIERLLGLLDEYFKQYPNPFFEASLENTLGRYAEMKGEFGTAVGHYEKALESSKNSVVNSSNEDVILQQQVVLARALHAIQQSERAESILRGVLKRYPTMATANIELSLMLIDQDKKAQALTNIELAKSVWADADPEYIEYQRFAELLEKVAQ